MRLLRLIPAVILGVFLGGVLGVFFTAGDPVYTIVWAVGIPALIVSSFFVSGLVTRSGAGGASGLALARVESVQRAGAEVNGMHDLDVRLVVAPDRGSAYTTTTRVQVPSDRVRDYNPGTVHVVTRPIVSAPDIRVVDTPDAAWLAKRDQANADPSRIPTSAPPWETATTTSPGTPRPGAARGFGLARTILIAGVAAALVLIPAYDSIGRAFTNLVTWDLDGSNMVSGNYQQVAVDEIVAVAGHTEFTSINFYSDYVLADGLTAPGASTIDSYSWRYGRAEREGPGFIQPSDLQAELFDVSDLDFSIIGEVVADATGRADVQGVESVYAFVRRDTSEPGNPPTIQVSISGAYEDPYFTYDFNGQLIREN